MPKMKQISIDVDINRVIESKRASFSESENDILRRMMLSNDLAQVKSSKLIPSEGFLGRSRGNWQVFLHGYVVATPNLKAAYCYLLRQLATEESGFFEKFSKLKSRSRRYIAREPLDLYDNAKHLAKDHAFELVPGWFVDTNLSEQQVAHRAKAAAETLGLIYGKDLRIQDGERTI